MKRRILTIGAGCQDLGLSLDDLTSFALAEIDWPSIYYIVCGVDPGWDQAMATTAIAQNIPVHIMIPYHGWELKWSKAIQKKARLLMEQAQAVTTWSEHIHDERPTINHMIDCCDEALVMAPAGWTSLRLDVAKLKKLPYINHWGSLQESGLL